MSDGVYSRKILVGAFVDSIKKLSPRHVIGNPVMFVVEVSFFFALILAIGAWIFGSNVALFNTEISILLLLTVWFSTFAEAISEGGGAEHKQKASESRGKRCVPKK
jgi:K+-transporting ATPase ATPase B chain